MRRAATLNRSFAAILLLALLVGMAALAAGWLQLLEERGALLRESRFQFSLNSLKSQLESGLQLGLPLPELPGAQARIEQTQAQEAAILSIDVFDLDGKILFTTDQNGIGANLPTTWRAPCLGASGWRAQDEDGHLRCQTLRNGYEQATGGVLLRYRLPTRATTLDALGERWPAPQMLLAAALLLALLGALGAGAGWLLLRPVENRLRRLAAAVASGQDVADGWLAGPLSAALARLEQRAEDLRAAEFEADRIDDLDLGPAND